MKLHAHQSEPRERRLSRIWPLLPSILGLACALLIGLAISEVITRFQHDADRQRQAQLLLARLDQDVDRLKALETQTATDPSLAEANDAFLDNFESLAQQHLAELRRLGNGGLPLRRIGQALPLYLVALEDEFRQFKTGKGSHADEIYGQRVGPAHDALAEAIQEADGRFGQAADAANRVSDRGTVCVLLFTVLLLCVSGGRYIGAQRFSARLAAEREVLQDSEERFRALISNVSDVIAILTPDGVVRYLSSAAQHLWGCAPETLQNTAFFDRVHPADADHARAAFGQVCGQPQGGLKVEARLRHTHGGWRTSELMLSNLLTEPGIAGVLLTCRDISERKAFEERLAHQAFHDALTGLPNRSLFTERLQHALGRARRQQTTVAVVFLDLDNFKLVNDGLGHEAGDHLLVAVAGRLRDSVRPGDTVARLGGDEFTILAEDLADEQTISDITERIVEALRQPIMAGGQEVFTTVSLGTAVSVGGPETPEDLLRDADTAMYRAKSNGKAQRVVFDRSMNTQAVERLELETDLRRALANGELVCHYQPIMLLETGGISEVEALVRWEHPVRGLIPPGRFIPLAEESGIIVALGRWVLEEACRQAREWQRLCPHQPPLTVSVNLSARQLQQPELVEDVVAILSRTGLHPTSLKLEITESVMMLNSEATLPKLLRLRSLGIRLAVDDFGTGYSSMAYLSSLPIDTLKVDRSFVTGIGQSMESFAIVRAIVMLAKALNLCVTSEGIETREQLARLKMLGCNQGQGYLFARPMPAEAFGVLLQEQHAAPDRPAEPPPPHTLFLPSAPHSQARTGT